MSDFPSTEKALKQRISSYRRSLTKEKQTHNFINDGYGKRYLLFCLYLLLGDHSKAQEYFYWYEKEFTDDADRDWMAGHYNSFIFRRIRNRYIEIYHESDGLEGVESQVGVGG